MSRLYQDAAIGVYAISVDHIGLKSYLSKQTFNGKMVALLVQTLKFLPLLDQIVTVIYGSSKNCTKYPFILHVMIYELLFGSSKIAGGGAIKRLITEKDTEIREYLNDLMREKGITDALDLLPAEIREDEKSRRSLTNTTNRAVNSQKYIVFNPFLDFPEDHNANSIATDLGATISADESVPNLYQISSTNSHFHRDLAIHPLIKACNFIQMNKSSCFPVLSLLQRFKRNSFSTADVILDACSAPGNKSFYLASFLRELKAKYRPRLLCVEINQERYQTCKFRLNKIMGNNEVKPVNVQVINHDFLEMSGSLLDEKDAISAILLDPSCSGSGMTSNNLDRTFECDWDMSSSKKRKQDEDRLYSLSRFQYSCLCHAMSNFPRCSCIAYSTCSIHACENEEVVYQALSACGYDLGWRCESILPFWQRRGKMDTNDECKLSDEERACMVNCDQVEDGVGGFFVCCLVRDV